MARVGTELVATEEGWSGLQTRMMRLMLRAVTPIYVRTGGRAYRENAVKATRQLAVALRDQGLNEHADRFTYRAQVLERRLALIEGEVGTYLFSALLAIVSGYGFRLRRIFFTYITVVLVFAAAFLIPVVAAWRLPSVQEVLNALQISLNAIHGRVFFAQFGLDTLQSWLATAESVIGIVIEGVFVAMIIQRLFR